MSGRAFLDTNVIVYLFDGRVPSKQLAAGRLLQRLVNEDVVRVVSTQVLQEAYSALTRKLGMDPAAALAALRMMEAARFSVEMVDVPLIWRGAERSIENKLSFWDGLILESARTAQCTVLYSEDFQTGMTFDGVTVRNPFA
jgi:predicted nucleic acid-binding protein